MLVDTCVASHLSAGPIEIRPKYCRTSCLRVLHGYVLLLVNLKATKIFAICTAIASIVSEDWCQRQRMQNLKSLAFDKDMTCLLLRESRKIPSGIVLTKPIDINRHKVIEIG